MFKDIKVAIIGLSGKSIFLNVDEFHKPEETIIANDMFIEPGGKGYNQAACLLKLGASVAYLTTVGSDEYGRICYDYLHQAKSSLYFKKIESSKTAVACILTNKHGDNQVTVYHGASKELNKTHVKEFASEIKNADILLMTLEPPIEVVEEAIRIAYDNNVLVILNPAPFNPDFKLYDLCDIIIPNEIEAKQLFKLPKDSNIVDTASKISKSFFLKDHLKTIIITTGSKGALIIQKDGTYNINGLKVKTVDTTGAGDVFNASFAYFYSQTKDLIKATEYANIAAAISTTKKHVLNSLPALDEILYFTKI